MPRSLTYLIGALILLVLGTILWFALPKDEEVLVEETLEVFEEPFVRSAVIGTSVEGRKIETFSYGTGDIQLLFVGGIHGGYEWNSVLLAYELMDYLEANPAVVPDGMRVTVIPSLNPDGVYAVTGVEGRFTQGDIAAETAHGRFNANDVDLNRNFDCKWQPESTWRSQPVSAGTAVFSEPEARALRFFVTTEHPDAVVFWHSQANAVYASECEEGVLPRTLELMNTYAQAAGYRSVPAFDAYPVTGDAEGWLASIGIPAITVELATHEDVEWEKNLRGVQAVLDAYAK